MRVANSDNRLQAGPYLAFDKSWSRLSSSFKFWLTAALAMIGFDCGVDAATEVGTGLRLVHC